MPTTHTTPDHFGSARVQAGGAGDMIDTVTNIDTSIDPSWTVVCVDFDDEHSPVSHALVKLSRPGYADRLSLTLNLAIKDLPEIELVAEFDDDGAVTLRLPSPDAVCQAIDDDELRAAPDQVLDITA